MWWPDLVPSGHVLSAGHERTATPAEIQEPLWEPLFVLSHASHVSLGGTA